MRCKETRKYGLLLLGALYVTGTFNAVQAQTAVSAAQPASPPAAASTSTAATPSATTTTSAATTTSADSTKAGGTPAASTAKAPDNDLISMTEPPRAEMIHRTLYAIYDKQDNHELAQAELDELIRLKPTDPVFPFAYGQSLMKDSKWADAIPRFQAATRLDPAFSNAYCGIGDCQMKLKKYTEAIDSYTLASRNAKLGQNFSLKVAAARQWQERKQQEDDFNKAVNKLNAPKSTGTKTGAKKK